MNIKSIAVTILLCTSLINPARSGDYAQDTLQLTLQEAEKLFLDQNLHLLASRYDIEAAAAGILQSRLWENPSLSLEQNIYNKYTGRSFDVTGKGQSIVQVQQLLLLAGKRNKRIKLAEANAKMTEYQFYDLLRSLKYELRSTFYDTYYLNQTIRMYDEEIASLGRTLDIFDILVKKSAISMKEVIRVKALLFTLESERLDMIKRMGENQAVLNTLLNLKAHQHIVPFLNGQDPDNQDLQLPPLHAVQDTALQRRMDLKMYEAEVQWQEHNLAYQKSLAVPDVRVGYLYDRAGSYIQNYNAVTLQIDLPFSNRNQGNIAMAKHRRDASLTRVSRYKQQLSEEIYQAYQKFSETARVYATLDKSTLDGFDDLMDIIMKNYEKRNISLVEFIDYYQAYKTSMLQIIRLRNERIQALEELNFFTGKNLLEF